MDNGFDITNILNSAPAPILVGLVITVILRILKQTPHVPDWTLPYWAVAFGMIAMGLMTDWTSKHLVSGFLSGAFAVYGNQLFRQTKERFGQSDETREFRRRFDQLKEEKVAQAEIGGPQGVIVTTPGQPSKVEIITKPVTAFEDVKKDV